MFMSSKEFSLVLRNTCHACFVNQPTLLAEVAHIKVTRMEENPLFQPELYRLKFTNCTGHSIIRVPEWIESSSQFFIYFTNEFGTLFVGSQSSPSSSLSIQSCILKCMTLMEEFSFPEVIVDEKSKQIILIMRGNLQSTVSSPTRHNRMKTIVFASTDGVSFEQLECAFPFDFENLKISQSNGIYYIIGRDVVRNCGVILRSPSIRGPWEIGPRLIHRFRSGSFLFDTNENNLWLFFTRIEDMPESILATRMKLNVDWREWPAYMTRFELVISPEEDYEGASIPHWESMPGRAYDEMNEIRYPHIITYRDQILLYYSIAGEFGIAGSYIQIMPSDDLDNDEDENSSTGTNYSGGTK